MSTPNSIKIDDVEYVRLDQVQPQASGDVYIVVLQRGWIMVGRLEKDGDQYTLNSAACIRQWGTTKGLGEIAFGGPTTKTILDHCPPVIFHELTAVLLMKCNSDNWKSHLR